MRLVRYSKTMTYIEFPDLVFYEIHAGSTVRRVKLRGEWLVFCKEEFQPFMEKYVVDTWEVHNRHQIKGIIALNGDNSAI